MPQGKCARCAEGHPPINSESKWRYRVTFKTKIDSNFQLTKQATDPRCPSVVLGFCSKDCLCRFLVAWKAMKETI